MARPRALSVALAAGMLLLSAAAGARAEEIWLRDGSRAYGLVQRVAKGGKLGVLLPNGKEEMVPLERIISIRFLGRDPLLVQTGTQEFRFINGGRLRGQILGNKGDRIRVQTAIAGIHNLDMSRFAGFVALPLAGYTGRRAEDLVASDLGKRSPYEDLVLDRRGGTYPGVVRRLTRTDLYFDIDGLLQVKPFPIHYVKGVRLADAGRDRKVPWKGDVQVFLWCRDGSVIQGRLRGINLGKWQLSPAWDPGSTMEVGLDEISLVQTLGGMVQYLSQLTPAEAKEKTVLAPPQPHRMDHSCQGDAISIAGNRYPWGIGVHADSELTFDLGGRYSEFRSAAGIDTRMGRRGSVRFLVLGDGKELYKSPVVRGSDDRQLEIRVPIPGVKKLTLKVTDAGDLDLGDAANWGSARVLRGIPAAPAPKPKPKPKPKPAPKPAPKPENPDGAKGDAEG
jgi:hypothetical protein